MAVLTYVTLICQDVEHLADFYVRLLKLEEITASRSEFYREVMTGGSKLGFASKGAYAALDLMERPLDGPVNTVLSFDVGALAQVDALTEAAVRAGTRLTKPAAVTTFSRYQSALLDPVGNLFRISPAAAQTWTHRTEAGVSARDRLHAARGRRAHPRDRPRRRDQPEAARGPGRGGAQGGATGRFFYIVNHGVAPALLAAQL